MLCSTLRHFYLACLSRRSHRSQYPVLKVRPRPRRPSRGTRRPRRRDEIYAPPGPAARGRGRLHGTHTFDSTQRLLDFFTHRMQSQYIPRLISTSRHGLPARLWSIRKEGPCTRHSLSEAVPRPNRWQPLSRALQMKLPAKVLRLLPSPSLTAGRQSSSPK